MPDQFRIAPLSQTRLDQAYPLVQALMPDIELDRWRMFAMRRLARTPCTEGHGIIVAEDARGYIHGLFCHAVGHHLRHGRVLEVDTFLVVNPFDSGPIIQHLVEGMEDLAARFECQAIYTCLPDSAVRLARYRHALADHLRGQGHGIEAVSLCRPLDEVHETAMRLAAAGG